MLHVVAGILEQRAGDLPLRHGGALRDLDLLDRPEQRGEALEVVDAELGQRPDAPVVEPGGPGRARRAVERAGRVRPADGAVGDAVHSARNVGLSWTNGAASSRRHRVRGEAKSSSAWPALPTRFLAEHVVSVLERESYLCRVQLGRRQDDHDVDVRSTTASAVSTSSSPGLIERSSFRRSAERAHTGP